MLIATFRRSRLFHGKHSAATWPDGGGGGLQRASAFRTSGSLRCCGRARATVAARPTTFEFVTDARARDARREVSARYVHLTEERMTEPILRFAIPVARAVSWRMAGLMLARGFRNLLAAASRHEATKIRGVSTSVPTQHGKEA